MASLHRTTISRTAGWLLAATAVGWLLGCGNESADSGATSVRPTTAASTIPSTAASTIPSTTTSTTSTTVAPPAEAELSLLGLGDSIPGALHCDTPCRSYVEVLGEVAAKALGKTVAVTNLATNDSLTSDGLLYRVKKNPAHAEAISKADIITIQIGFNDWQGPCTWSGHEECTSAGAVQASDNLGTILDLITTLRKGEATAIRVVTYYDNTIGDAQSRAAWHFPADGEAAFHTWYASALVVFNTTMCDVAQSHGAVCIDLVGAFNGPSGDQDAAGLVGGDHLHPTQAGHELIAATIDAAGYAPIA